MWVKTWTIIMREIKFKETTTTVDDRNDGNDRRPKRA
jgi:hypothetical protein